MPKYSVLKNKTNSDFSKFVLFPFGGENGVFAFAKIPTPFA